MSIEALTLLFFGALLFFLILGLPLAFVLGGVSVVFLYFTWGFDSFYMVASQIWGTMGSFTLVAIPLFVFMAMVLERTGVARDLYRMMHLWCGGLRGGLALGTLGICAVFAAGIMPGVLLMVLTAIYILVRSHLQPELAPALPKEERASWSEKFRALRAVLLPIGVVVMVLGSIIGGITTPTEAAAMGVLGALISAAVRLQPVLPERDRAAGYHHGRHLPLDHPLCPGRDRRPGADHGVPGNRHLAAGPVLLTPS